MQEPTTTAKLCTTVAMVRSVESHVSGGYTSEIDLLPVWRGNN